MTNYYYNSGATLPTTSGSGYDTYWLAADGTFTPFTVGSQVLDWHQSGLSVGSECVYRKWGDGADPIIDMGGYNSNVDLSGSYIKVIDIVFQNCGAERALACDDNANGYWRYVDIDGCTFKDTDGYGSGIEEYQVSYYVNFLNCSFQNNGQARAMGGLYIMGSQTQYHPDATHHIVVGSCTFYNSYGDAFTFHNGSSDPDLYLGEGCVIRDCTVDLCDNDGIDLNTGTNVKCYNNTVTRWGRDGGNYGIAIDGTATGSVYNNKMYDGLGYGGMRCAAPNFNIYNNLCVGSHNTQPVFIINDVNTEGNGVSVRNVKINNNTFVRTNGGVGSPNHIVRFADENGNLGSVEFNSNLLTATAVGSDFQDYVDFQQATFPASDLITCDKNVYGSNTFTASDVSSQRTWSYWQETLGYDTNGVNSDPLLTDLENEDYSLTSSSPARGLGQGGIYGDDAGYLDYSGGESSSSITASNITLKNIVLKIT